MALIEPTTILQPFANLGDKDAIPNAASPTPGKASMEEGFPPETMEPIETGGVPPSGLDFNGILNLTTSHDQWQSAGGQYKFNSALATAIGGYSKGMVVLSNDGLTLYMSLVDSNTTDFNTTPGSVGTLWAVSGGAGANGVTSISTTGGTSTLTPVQYNAAIIYVSGVLASNTVLVMPVPPRRWTVINTTTGGFTVTVKTAAGTGVTVTQGFSDTVVADGTNIQYASADAVTQTPGTSNKTIANTEFVASAVAASAFVQGLYMQGLLM